MPSRREPTPARAASLDAVAVFVEVVRARSFTGAARALGLPKSTVSVRVAELEAHLGVTLLHRTTRRVQPTPAGEAYFASAARSLADLHAAGLEATHAQSAPSGVLRVTGTGAGTGDIGDRIAEYLALYPGVSVDLVLTNQRLDLLGEGIDVAFRIGALGDDPTLTAHRIGTVDLALYASPGYLRARPAPSHPRDLDDHALLVTANRPTMRLVHADGSRHTMRLVPRFTSNHVAALRHQILRGSGIGVQPIAVGDGDVRSGALVRVLDGWSFGTSPVNLVYLRQRHLPRRVRLFVDLVLERARAAKAGARGHRSAG